jgi:hypothetical protein
MFYLLQMKSVFENTFRATHSENQNIDKNSGEHHASVSGELKQSSYRQEAEGLLTNGLHGNSVSIHDNT